MASQSSGNGEHPFNVIRQQVKVHRLDFPDFSDEEQVVRPVARPLFQGNKRPRVGPAVGAASQPRPHAEVDVEAMPAGAEMPCPSAAMPAGAVEPPRYRVNRKRGLGQCEYVWYHWHVRRNPPSQAQQRAAWNFFRDVFLQRSLPYIVNRSGAEDRKLAYVTASERWRIMPREERAMWFYHAMLDPPQSAIPLQEQFTEEPQNDDDKEDEYANAKVRSFMLTFNGDWLQGNRCLQQWLDIGVSDQELCIRIGALPEVDDLIDRFHQHMTNLAKACGLREISSALEVSLSARRRGRVHLHTFMSSHSGNSRVRMKFLTDMVVFDGWRPHVSYTVCAGGASGRSTKSMNARINEGHYYLQFAKYGSLRRATNWHKYKDFPVQKKWIFNRYKVRQMSDEVAEEAELSLERECLYRGSQGRSCRSDSMVVPCAMPLERRCMLGCCEGGPF
jgi:hypothetical protein